MRALKNLLKTTGNVHRRGPKKDILLFATPRGGSTWLMEVIGSQPGMKFYDEPFNVRRENVARLGLFSGWRDLMPGAATETMILDYIRGLQANRFGSMNPPPFRRNHRFFTNRIVFKIHELEHMMHRIATECDGKIVFLLRHPIATTVSRWVYPRLDLFLESEYYRGMLDDEVAYREICRLGRDGTKLQKGLVCWCFENLVPLHEPGSDWLILTYEELVLNPARCARLLHAELELQDLGRVLQAMGEPSTNIGMSNDATLDIMRDEDGLRRRRRLVTKWKTGVSDEDQSSMSRILELFRLDTYSSGRFLAHARYRHFPETSEVLGPAS